MQGAKAVAPKYDPSIVFATWEGQYITSGEPFVPGAVLGVWFEAGRGATRAFYSHVRVPRGAVPAHKQGESCQAPAKQPVHCRNSPSPAPGPAARPPGANPVKEFEPITLTAVIDGVFACNKAAFTYSKLFTFRQLGLKQPLLPGTNTQGLQAMCGVTPMTQVGTGDVYT